MTHSGILGDERDGEAAGGLMEGSETATQAVRPLFSPSIPGRASLGLRLAETPTPTPHGTSRFAEKQQQGKNAPQNAAVCFTSSVVAFQFEAFYWFALSRFVT